MKRSEEEHSKGVLGTEGKCCGASAVACPVQDLSACTGGVILQRSRVSVCQEVPAPAIPPTAAPRRRRQTASPQESVEPRLVLNSLLSKCHSNANSSVTAR